MEREEYARRRRRLMEVVGKGGIAILRGSLAPEGAVAKEVEELAQSGGRSDLERGAGELLQMATAILEDINTARTAPHDEEAS